MDMQVIRDQPRQVPKTFRGEFPRNLLSAVAEVVADSDRPAHDLAASDFFGEAALLTDQPRSATVIAKTDVVLYALQKDNFHAALDASATFKEQIQLALFNRQ